MTNTIECHLCDFVGHTLLEHLPIVHNLSTRDYLLRFEGAATVSPEFQKKFQLLMNSAPERKPPEPLFRVGEVPFRINPEVPLEACLSLPEHYRFPQHGELATDLQHASASLSSGRSIYLSGISGSGKDAFIHALSYYTRRPAEVFQIQPGADISHWLYSRSFNNEGTYWEEGKLLKCLRDGYKTSSGKVVPYLVLISDLDRADASQIEILRLILDSIQKRVKGPGGVTHPVLPGTQIVATANTTGGGDNRGQYLSANPIDSSIISRFESGFEFHWMDWADEKLIVEKKFPHLFKKEPEALRVMGKVTKKLREAINQEDISCDFSHRDLCSWLQHAEDLLTTWLSPPKYLLKVSMRAWTDRLPDRETQLEAKRLIDAILDGGAL